MLGANATLCLFSPYCPRVRVQVLKYCQLSEGPELFEGTVALLETFFECKISNDYQDKTGPTDADTASRAPRPAARPREISPRPTLPTTVPYGAAKRRTVRKSHQNPGHWCTRDPRVPSA